MPALDAAYAAAGLMAPFLPAIELIMMIRPQPPSRIPGSTRRRRGTLR